MLKDVWNLFEQLSKNINQVHFKIENVNAKLGPSLASDGLRFPFDPPSHPDTQTLALSLRTL